MKVLVLGGGVVGTTAAFELAGDGHQVNLIERQSGPALETSFANAGEISPGYSAPWAGPGVPFKAIKWLLMQHRPLVIRPHLDMGLISRIGSARPELCEIEDVAECVAFLATPAARGYHGACVQIDAGVTAG